MKVKLVLLLITISVIICFKGAAQESVYKTIYVGGNGTGIVDGSKQHPYTSVANALKWARDYVDNPVNTEDGVIVKIIKGIYYLGILPDIQVLNLHPTKRIYVESEDEMDFTILDGRNPADDTFYDKYAFTFYKCSNITIRNFEIRNCRYIGVWMEQCNYMEVKNIVAYNNGFNGNYITPTSKNKEGLGFALYTGYGNKVENNLCYNNGPGDCNVNPDDLSVIWPSLGDGLGTWGQRMLSIKYNVFYDNIGNGYLLEDSMDVKCKGNTANHYEVPAPNNWYCGGVWIDGGFNIEVDTDVYHSNLVGALVADEEGVQSHGFVVKNSIIRDNVRTMEVRDFHGEDIAPPVTVVDVANNDFDGPVKTGGGFFAYLNVDVTHDMNLDIYHGQTLVESNVVPRAPGAIRGEYLQNSSRDLRHNLKANFDATETKYIKIYEKLKDVKVDNKTVKYLTNFYFHIYYNDIPFEAMFDVSPDLPYDLPEMEIVKYNKKIIRRFGTGQNGQAYITYEFDEVTPGGGIVFYEKYVGAIHGELNTAHITPGSSISFVTNGSKVYSQQPLEKLIIPTPTPLPDLVYYVDSKNGNDGNGGLTRDMAFKTIKRAVQEFPTLPRDAYIVLLPGYYPEQVDITNYTGTNKIYISGDVTSDLNLKATLDGDLDADGISDFDYGFNFSGSSNIQVDNVFVKNYKTAGVKLYKSSHITFDSVVVSDCGFASSYGTKEGYGVDVCESEYITIKDSLFYWNGPGKADFINNILGAGLKFFKVKNSAILRNISTKNYGTGFFIRSSSNIIVDGNSAYDHKKLFTTQAGNEDRYSGYLVIDGMNVDLSYNMAACNQTGVVFSDIYGLEMHGHSLTDNKILNNDIGLFFRNLRAYGIGDIAPGVIDISGNYIEENLLHNVLGDNKSHYEVTPCAVSGTNVDIATPTTRANINTVMTSGDILDFGYMLTLKAFFGPGIDNYIKLSQAYQIVNGKILIEDGIYLSLTVDNELYIGYEMTNIERSVVYNGNEIQSIEFKFLQDCNFDQFIGKDLSFAKITKDTELVYSFNLVP